MKALIVLGTRPEAVKLAPVYEALAYSRIEPVLCLTSQHRELLTPVLELFGLKPDFDLDVMTPGQTLDGLTARLMTRLGEVYDAVSPQVALVQGDTTTTFCGALSAFYHQVPVGHVEAGLRTGDFTSPYPEEMNRVLTTRLATWHFAPTEHNRETLLREGVDERAIHVTGNPVIDALATVRKRLDEGNVSAAARALLERFSRPFVLVTGHRRESFGAPFKGLCRGLHRVAEAHPEIDLVYPVHLNPNVRSAVEPILGNQPNVHLIEPLGYEPFLALMNQAQFVITDSGGVQEEAPALGKPVLVMRETTERVETVGGAVRLVGTDPDAIYLHSHRLLTEPAYFEQMATADSPYGDGEAAARIVAVLEDDLTSRATA